MWKRMLLASRRHPELRNSASTRGWFVVSRRGYIHRRRAAHKKHISRSCRGCGQGGPSSSNISNQIDTIPQTSVVRKPSRAPTRPPPSSHSLSFSLYLPLWRLRSQISSKLEHRQDVDKPVIDVRKFDESSHRTCHTIISSTIHIQLFAKRLLLKQCLSSFIDSTPGVCVKNRWRKNIR